MPPTAATPTSQSVNDDDDGDDDGDDGDDDGDDDNNGKMMPPTAATPCFYAPELSSSGRGGLWPALPKRRPARSCGRRRHGLRDLERRRGGGDLERRRGGGDLERRRGGGSAGG